MPVIAVRNAVVALCLAMVGLAGCKPAMVTATIRVEFEESTREDRERAAGILRARFEEILGTHSSVEIQPADGAVINFEVRSESLPVNDLDYYAGTQGVLEMTSVDPPGTLLITDRDVESTRTWNTGERAILAFSVTEEAGKRMLEYTSRNPGKLIATSWDGGYETHSTIQGEMSRHFQVSDLDPVDALRRRTVLEHGRLPVAVGRVDITIAGNPRTSAKCEWGECPEHGKQYRDRLAAAIARADRIVVTEHSSPWDARNESSESLAPQDIVYSAVTLSAQQREQFGDAIERMSTITQDWMSGCLPAWHHTVSFYEQDRLASTMKICFECSQVQWDGGDGLTHPKSIHEVLRNFVANTGLHPHREWRQLVLEHVARN